MNNKEISVSGFLKKVIYRDEKTGYSTFLLTTEDERFAKRHIGERDTDIMVSGVIPLFPHKTPLLITGTYRYENKPLFFASKCEQRSSNDAFTIEFLKQKYFAGIGQKTIERIIKVVDGDIFAFCAQEDAAKILTATDSKIRINVAQLLVSKIRELKNIENLLHYLVKYGGDFLSAKEIYEKYGDDSIRVIEENPYLLSYTGLSYEAREAIAKKRNFKTHDDRRLKALIEECFSIVESRGNTCVSLKKLLELVAFVEKKANMGYETNPIVLIANLFQLKSEFVFREENEDLFFYTRRTYEIEERAARHIVRLSRSKIPFPTARASIEEIEKDSDITYGEEQKNAFKLFDSSGVKILTGGPGTGKSTVIDGLLQYYRQMFPGNIVALCAPTGAAAKKLREVTKGDARTIHKLLDVKPFGKDDMQYKDEYDQLPYDLIIVDESSMIDIELFMMLLSGVKSGALVLFVGDEDQLSSVGPGNVLHDMIDSGYIPSCQLRKVYRQKGDSSIVENSIRMREGNINLVQDDSFEIIRVSNQIELEKKAIEIIQRESKGHRKQDMKVYSPVRNPKYIVSTYFMNKRLHDLFGLKGEKQVVYDGTTFTVGDPIIMVNNNYALGYLNGDEGIVSDIVEEENGMMVMMLTMSDGTFHEISGKYMSDVELAYAITVHKSQGAECDTAIVLLPATPRNMLERSLIYVGATRAKRKNIIITENDALERAIENTQKKNRFSGLNAQVRKIAK
jgi:ATP-dependent exoDNAse (exonuclease V), alpha subunit - helicase superfamily I member